MLLCLGHKCFCVSLHVPYTCWYKLKSELLAHWVCHIEMNHVFVVVRKQCNVCKSPIKLTTPINAILSRLVKSPFLCQTLTYMSHVSVFDKTTLIVPGIRSGVKSQLAVELWSVCTGILLTALMVKITLAAILWFWCYNYAPTIWNANLEQKCPVCLSSEYNEGLFEDYNLSTAHIQPWTRPVQKL